MSLFDDYDEFEPWQTMSDNALIRMQSWAHMASLVFVAVASDCC